MIGMPLDPEDIKPDILGKRRIAMLTKEFEYYKAHLPEFLRDHRGEFVVIQGEMVMGFYPTEELALRSMAAQELGTFFVKVCLPPDETVIEYHSRAAFV